MFDCARSNESMKTPPKSILSHVEFAVPSDCIFHHDRISPAWSSRASTLGIRIPIPNLDQKKLTRDLKKLTRDLKKLTRDQQKPTFPMPARGQEAHETSRSSRGTGRSSKIAIGLGERFECAATSTALGCEADTTKRGRPLWVDHKM